MTRRHDDDDDVGGVAAMILEPTVVQSRRSWSRGDLPEVVAHAWLCVAMSPQRDGYTAGVGALRCNGRRGIVGNDIARALAR